MACPRRCDLSRHRVSTSWREMTSERRTVPLVADISPCNEPASLAWLPCPGSVDATHRNRWFGPVTFGVVLDISVGAGVPSPHGPRNVVRSRARDLPSSSDRQSDRTCCWISDSPRERLERYGDEERQGGLMPRPRHADRPLWVDIQDQPRGMVFMSVGADGSHARPARFPSSSMRARAFVCHS